VTFNDPRRFGLMDLVRVDGWPRIRRFRSMGPEPLDDAFDAAALARVCTGKRAALKVVLLDQRRVAGVGNIYASEALHRAALSPRRRASTIATPGGAPRESAFRLVAAIKAVLQDAVTRQYQRQRFPLSRLRARGAAMPAAWMHGHDPPNHTSGPFDVLLPDLSALRFSES
jgi:formamidopyrimidine-DNA glycosylase